MAAAVASKSGATDVRTLHGLIQYAAKQANEIPWKAYPGGKGYRIWAKKPVAGWDYVGELSRLEDVEDLFLAKLDRE